MNTIEYRNEASQYAWDYFATHPCVDCGESDPIVLEFDHVRGEKVDAISAMIGRGFQFGRIKEEIENVKSGAVIVTAEKLLKIGVGVGDGLLTSPSWFLYMDTWKRRIGPPLQTLTTAIR